MIFLYVKFDTRFVYIGGIQSSVMTSSNQLIPKEDFSQDWRKFLAKTGVKSLTISGQGFVSDKLPKELFARLYSALAKGTELECRIEEIVSDSAYLTASGQFFLTQLNKNDAINAPIQYNFSLQSSGEVKFS